MPANRLMLWSRTFREHGPPPQKATVVHLVGAGHACESALGLVRGCRALRRRGPLPRDAMASFYALRIFSTMAVVELFSTKPRTRTSPPQALTKSAPTT